MPTTPLPRRRDRSPGKDRARALVKAWENGLPRRRISPGKEQILVRGVVIATKVTAAKPAKQQPPSATKAKAAKPSAAIPALPAARILRLTQFLAFVDYCAVGAMRTVLPYYLRSLGGAGKHVGGLETAYGVGQIVGADGQPIAA